MSDAPRSAGSRARGTAQRSFWREYAGTFAFLFFLFMFRSAWADWVSVPSGSMNPTLLEGDRVLLDKHVFGVRIPWTLVRLTEGRDPRRGEIVVFDSPADGVSLIKRVIGEPGDVVALGESGLSINGVPAQYSAGDAAHLDAMLAAMKARDPVLLRESGVIRAHDVLRLPDRPGPSFAPVRVPVGTYLVLGDSRDNSRDSRYIGFVPRRNIVGLASRVVVSFDPENYWLPRENRLLAALE